MRNDRCSAAVPLVVVLLTGLVAGCGADPEAQPAAALPAPVAAGVAELASLCKEAGGTPRMADAVRRADFNGDGREDFVLFAGWAQCENAWSIYGDREKAVNVFAGDAAGGATHGFADTVFGASIEIADGRAVLWVDTMGASCGRPPAATFAEESFCSRALVAKGAAEFDYAPVATVRMIE